MGNKYTKQSWNSRLIDAVMRYDTVTVQDCLEHMADPNGCTDNGESVLVIASADKRGTDIVRLLLKHGANPNTVSNTINSIVSNTFDIKYVTPLLIAIQNSNTETVHLLINAGADPNYRHPKWRCSIIEQIHYVSILQILLNAGLKIDNDTVAQYIYKYGNRSGYCTDIVRILIENVNDASFITYALDSNSIELLTTLVEYGYIHV